MWAERNCARSSVSSCVSCRTSRRANPYTSPATSSTAYAACPALSERLAVAVRLVCGRGQYGDGHIEWLGAAQHAADDECSFHAGPHIGRQLHGPLVGQALFGEARGQR